MPPIISTQGLRLNKELDIKYLEVVVPTWVKYVIAGRPYFWQNDPAQC